MVAVHGRGGFNAGPPGRPPLYHSAANGGKVDPASPVCALAWSQSGRRGDKGRLRIRGSPSSTSRPGSSLIVFGPDDDEIVVI